MKEFYRGSDDCSAANKAIKRYPYFAVKVQIDESGSYVKHTAMSNQ